MHVKCNTKHLCSRLGGQICHNGISVLRILKDLCPNEVRTDVICGLESPMSDRISSADFRRNEALHQENDTDCITVIIVIDVYRTISVFGSQEFRVTFLALNKEAIVFRDKLLQPRIEIAERSAITETKFR